MLEPLLRALATTGLGAGADLVVFFGGGCSCLLSVLMRLCPGSLVRFFAAICKTEGMATSANTSTAAEVSITQTDLPSTCCIAISDVRTQQERHAGALATGAEKHRHQSVVNTDSDRCRGCLILALQHITRS